jgi:hypothetical protein
MMNDELQATEIQETDAIAAVQVASEEVEVVAVIEDAADPNEAVSNEVEAVAEAEGEEE